LRVGTMDLYETAVSLQMLICIKKGARRGWNAANTDQTVMIWAHGNIFPSKSGAG
jgi:hypothetical protein